MPAPRPAAGLFFLLPTEVRLIVYQHVATDMVVPLGRYYSSVPNTVLPSLSKIICVEAIPITYRHATFYLPVGIFRRVVDSGMNVGDAWRDKLRQIHKLLIPPLIVQLLLARFDGQGRDGVYRDYCQTFQSITVDLKIVCDCTLNDEIHRGRQAYLGLQGGWATI